MLFFRVFLSHSCHSLHRRWSHDLQWDCHDDARRDRLQRKMILWRMNKNTIPWNEDCRWVRWHCSMDLSQSRPWCLLRHSWASRLPGLHIRENNYTFLLYCLLPKMSRHFLISLFLLSSVRVHIHRYCSRYSRAHRNVEVSGMLGCTMLSLQWDYPLYIESYGVRGFSYSWDECSNNRGVIRDKSHRETVSLLPWQQWGLYLVRLRYQGEVRLYEK